MPWRFGNPVSWRIVCEWPDILLTQHQLISWINVLSSAHLMLFTTARFAVHCTGLIKLCQQLVQRWWRPVSVWKHADKLLQSITFFLMQNFSLVISLSSVLKTIVCYCLHKKRRVNDVNIAGTRVCLYGHLKRHFLEIPFFWFAVHSILFSQILCATSKLTKSTGH